MIMLVGLTSSSSITQSMVSFEPMLIAPKMGIETLSPLFPRWTYSALLAARDCSSPLGMGGRADILDFGTN